MSVDVGVGGLSFWRWERVVISAVGDDGCDGDWEEAFTMSGDEI